MKLIICLELILSLSDSRRGKERIEKKNRERVERRLKQHLSLKGFLDLSSYKHNKSVKIDLMDVRRIKSILSNFLTLFHTMKRAFSFAVYVCQMKCVLISLFSLVLIDLLPVCGCC